MRLKAYVIIIKEEEKDVIECDLFNMASDGYVLTYQELTPAIEVNSESVKINPCSILLPNTKKESVNVEEVGE